MEKNLYELLKNAPDGLVMYSRAHGQVRVYKRDISHNPECTKAFRLEPNLPFGGTCGYLDQYGKLYGNGECLLFPTSKATNWDNWQFALMRQQPCIGEVVVDERDGKLYQLKGYMVVRNQNGHDGLVEDKYYSNFRFAEQHEKIKFFYLQQRNYWNNFKFQAILYKKLSLIANARPGDLVLVKDADTEWTLGHFLKYDTDSMLFYTTESDIIKKGYQYCMLYNDDTKKYLFTDEPFINQDDFIQFGYDFETQGLSDF